MRGVLTRLVTAALTVSLVLTAAGPTGAAPWSGEDRTPLEQDDAAHLLAVVTKDIPIQPIDYASDDLVDWPGTDFQLRAEVHDQLQRLFTAAEAEGLGYRVVSAYRSHDTQAATYDYWVRHYGRASADATSARAGHSEHQTGLAVDVDNLTGECYLDQCFGQTDEGRWLAEHGHEFGFIISYPKGTRSITGYAYEPWHVRYVGPLVAGDMHRRGYQLLSTYLAPPASSVRIGELLGSRG